MALRRDSYYGIDGMMEAEGDPWGGGYSDETPSWEQPEQTWSNPDPWQEPSGGGGTTEPTSGWAQPQGTPTEPAAPTRDTSSWDTNGYATPGYTATNFGNAPSGWDQTKWTDPNHQSPKYVVGRILYSVGDLKDPANRERAIQQIQQAYPGTTFNGKDRINVPGIGEVDIFTGASAGIYGGAWQDLTAAAKEQAAAGTSSGGYPNSGASVYGGSSGYQTPSYSAPSYTPTQYTPQIYTPPTAPPIDPASISNSGSTLSITNSAGEGPPAGMNEELWKMLMERAKQGLNVNAEDPAVKGQAEAYSAQAQRARRDYLGDQAESSSPYSTGAMEGVERMTAESMGQDIGKFESELIGREITARRNEIQHSLDTMGDVLTEQQRMQLQMELSKMDQALEHTRLRQQNEQFYAGMTQADKHMMANLSQRDAQFYANLGQADRQFLAQLQQQGRFQEMDDAFRKMQLGQQQNQFLDDLGFRQQEQRNYWDWRQRGND